MKKNITLFSDYEDFNKFIPLSETKYTIITTSEKKYSPHKKHIFKTFKYNCISPNDQKIFSETFSQICRHKVQYLQCYSRISFCTIDHSFYPAFSMPFISEKTLEKVLKERLLLQKWKQETALNCMFAVAQGLSYLHDHLMCHGNLCPSNVVVDKAEQCYLIDFGLYPIKKLYVEKNEIADKDYRDTGTGKKCPTRVSDVYSFGVLMSHLCVTFLQGGKVTLRQFLANDDPHKYDHFPKFVSEIIPKCVDRSAENRPTISQVIKMFQDETYKIHDYYSKFVKSMYIENLANLDDPSALNKLGEMYFRGELPDTNDHEKALFYFKKSADLKHSEGMSNYGVLLIDMYDEGSEKEKEGAKLLRMSAEQENVHGMANLGVSLLEGDGFVKDIEEGEKYLKRSADLGYKYAQVNYGFSLVSNNQTKQRIEEGLKYIKMAMDQNYPDAYYTYGVLLQMGEVVEKNDQLAMHYFRIADELGYDKATYELGEGYYKGRGVKKNKYIGQMYYKKAAAKQNQEAIEKLNEFKLRQARKLKKTEVNEKLKIEESPEDIENNNENKPKKIKKKVKQLKDDTNNSETSPKKKVKKKNLSLKDNEDKIINEEQTSQLENSPVKKKKTSNKDDVLLTKLSIKNNERTSKDDDQLNEIHEPQNINNELSNNESVTQIKKKPIKMVVKKSLLGRDVYATELLTEEPTSKLDTTADKNELLKENVVSQTVPESKNFLPTTESRISNQNSQNKSSFEGLITPSEQLNNYQSAQLSESNQQTYIQTPSIILHDLSPTESIISYQLSQSKSSLVNVLTPSEQLNNSQSNVSNQQTNLQTPSLVLHDLSSTNPIQSNESNQQANLQTPSIKLPDLSSNQMNIVNQPTQNKVISPLSQSNMPNQHELLQTQPLIMHDFPSSKSNISNQPSRDKSSNILAPSRSLENLQTSQSSVSNQTSTIKAPSATLYPLPSIKTNPSNQQSPLNSPSANLYTLPSIKTNTSTNSEKVESTAHYTSQTTRSNISNQTAQVSNANSAFISPHQFENQAKEKSLEQSNLLQQNNFYSLQTENENSTSQNQPQKENANSNVGPANQYLLLSQMLNQNNLKTLLTQNPQNKDTSQPNEKILDTQVLAGWLTPILQALPETQPTDNNPLLSLLYQIKIELQKSNMLPQQNQQTEKENPLQNDKNESDTSSKTASDETYQQLSRILEPDNVSVSSSETQVSNDSSSKSRNTFSLLDLASDESGVSQMNSQTEESMSQNITKSQSNEQDKSKNNLQIDSRAYEQLSSILDPNGSTKTKQQNKYNSSTSTQQKTGVTYSLLAMTSDESGISQSNSQTINTNISSQNNDTSKLPQNSKEEKSYSLLNLTSDESGISRSNSQTDNMRSSSISQQSSEQKVIARNFNNSTEKSNKQIESDNKQLASIISSNNANFTSQTGNKRSVQIQQETQTNNDSSTSQQKAGVIYSLMSLTSDESSFSRPNSQTNNLTEQKTQKNSISPESNNQTNKPNAKIENAYKELSNLLKSINASTLTSQTANTNSLSLQQQTKAQTYNKKPVQIQQKTQANNDSSTSQQKAGVIYSLMSLNSDGSIFSQPNSQTNNSTEQKTQNSSVSPESNNQTSNPNPKIDNAYKELSNLLKSIKASSLSTQTTNTNSLSLQQQTKAQTYNRKSVQNQPNQQINNDSSTAQNTKFYKELSRIIDPEKTAANLLQSKPKSNDSLPSQSMPKAQNAFSLLNLNSDDAGASQSNSKTLNLTPDNNKSNQRIESNDSSNVADNITYNKLSSTFKPKSNSETKDDSSLNTPKNPTNSFSLLSLESDESPSSSQAINSTNTSIEYLTQNQEKVQLQSADKQKIQGNSFQQMNPLKMKLPMNDILSQFKAFKKEFDDLKVPRKTDISEYRLFQYEDQFINSKDPRIIYKFAKIYDHIENSRINHEKAMKYYKMSADLGYAKAQAYFGTCLQNGQGVEKDESLGMRYLKMSADQGNLSGIYNYGISLYKGIGSEKNQVLGLEYIKQVADRGNPEAQLKYGCWNNDPFVGHEYIEKAVKQNNKEALVYYADDFMKGHGVAQDVKKAAKIYLFLFNAEKKTNVLIKLIKCLRQFDMAKAFQYIKILADSDDTKKIAHIHKAQYELGFELLIGNYLQKDVKEAIKYLAKSKQDVKIRDQYPEIYAIMRHDFSSVQDEVEKFLYRNGKPDINELQVIENAYKGDANRTLEAAKMIEKTGDFKTANFFYEIAADSNQVEAFLIVAKNYLEGRNGCEIDQAKGNKYMKRALESGYVSRNQLNEISQKNEISQENKNASEFDGLSAEALIDHGDKLVSSNPEEALAYYKAAAAKGDGRAYFKCAEQCLSVEEKLDYYELAIDKKVPEAFSNWRMRIFRIFHSRGGDDQFQLLLKHLKKYNDFADIAYLYYKAEDEEKSDIFYQAAKKNIDAIIDGEQQYCFALLCEKHNEIELAVRMYKKADENGYLKAKKKISHLMKKQQNNND